MLCGSNLEYRPCYICRGETFEELVTVPYIIDANNTPMHYDHRLCRCKRCGSYNINPILVEGILAKYYEQSSSYELYDGKNGILASYDKKAEQHYQFIKSNIPPKNLRILDFGCATGYALVRFKNNGNDLVGFDTSLVCSMIGFEKYGLRIETDYDKIANRRYDLIMLSHVLEHLCKPDETIASLSNLLSENGYFYLEVPDIDFFNNHISGELFKHISFEHLNYYNKQLLKEFMRNAGFRLWGIDTKANNDDVMPHYPVILSLWQKNSETDNSDKEVKYIQSKSFEGYIEKQKQSVEEYRRRIKERVGDKKVIVYGAGTHTYRLVAICDFLKDNIVGYADSNKKKHNKKFIFDKLCLDIEDFQLDTYDAVLISSASSENAIYNHLRDLENIRSKEIIRLYDKQV